LFAPAVPWGIRGLSLSTPPTPAMHASVTAAPTQQTRGLKRASARIRRVRVAATQSAPPVASDWRSKAQPIKPGSSYPAKEHCSNCGLCDTYYVAHVKTACAFLGDGTHMPLYPVPLPCAPRWLDLGSHAVRRYPIIRRRRMQHHHPRNNPCGMLVTPCRPVLGALPTILTPAIPPAPHHTQPSHATPTAAP
jgi:hypothetical protein